MKIRGSNYKMQAKDYKLFCYEFKQVVRFLVRIVLYFSCPGHFIVDYIRQGYYLSCYSNSLKEANISILIYK